MSIITEVVSVKLHFEWRSRISNSSGGLGIILVTYGNENDMKQLYSSIRKAKTDADFIVLVDNHPDHGCAKIAESMPAIDVVIRSENVGFAAGCNRAVNELPADIKLILLLNPDMVPKPQAITKLRDGGQADWSAWMGLVLLPNGTVNTAGNVVHISGLAWCGQYGQPPASALRKTTVQYLSGACLMVRRKVWEELGGFEESYFTYYEDIDLSLRMAQRGLKLGIVPTAHFEHDYSFEKGSQKWFYLERNRYIFICRQWPMAIIIILLPLLCACEGGLWAVSMAEGRFFLRLRSLASFMKLLPSIIAGRKASRQHNRLTAQQFLGLLQPRIDTSQLSIPLVTPLNALFALYYRVACRLLSLG